MRRFLCVLACVCVAFAMPKSDKGKGGDAGGFGIAPDLLSKLANIPDLDPALLKTILASLKGRSPSPDLTAQPAYENIVEQEPEPPKEPCPETADGGIEHYCGAEPDGLYFDPWNPFCGYIRCEGGRPARQVCPQGTWMGTRSSLGLGTAQLCQKWLARSDADEAVCPEMTDMDMCSNAYRVQSPRRTQHQQQQHQQQQQQQPAEHNGNAEDGA